MAVMLPVPLIVAVVLVEVASPKVIEPVSEVHDVKAKPPLGVAVMVIVEPIVNQRLVPEEVTFPFTAILPPPVGEMLKATRNCVT